MTSSSSRVGGMLTEDVQNLGPGYSNLGQEFNPAVYSYADLKFKKKAPWIGSYNSSSKTSKNLLQKMRLQKKRELRPSMLWSYYLQNSV
jgi:hypothetical protein